MKSMVLSAVVMDSTKLYIAPTGYYEKMMTDDWKQRLADAHRPVY